MELNTLVDILGIPDGIKNCFSDKNDSSNELDSVLTDAVDPLVTDNSEINETEDGMKQKKESIDSTNNFGMKMSQYSLFGAQDFIKIKEQCLADGTLFEDPFFSGDDISWSHTKELTEGLTVKRPRDISSDPQFLVSGVDRFDVNQGNIGNCWFLGAVASLTTNKKLFNAVVLPEDNTFEEGKYCGAFHFRFWQNGKWVDVVIDDRLPTQDGELVYVSSKEANEFWPALLEKAYAKLHGNYQNLEAGFTNESFTNFTGGITEFYETKNSPSTLFKIMEKADQRSSFMCCSTPTMDSDVEEETGLVGNHVYSITRVRRIPDADARLMCVRNPHGKGEWKGTWNDESEEWGSVDDALKQELDLTIKDDGEFWISFEDFLMRFQYLEICHWDAETFCGQDVTDGGMEWQCRVFEEKWIRGATAGGCPRLLDEKDYPRESFACNPQYVINLVDPDDDDDRHECTIIIALLQKNTRERRKDNVYIGFQIYSLPDPDSQSKPLPSSFFASNEPVAKGPEFQDIWQVCKRFTLDPGTYVIVPCTKEPNVEAEFILRVYTEVKVDMKEHDGKLRFGDASTRFENDISEMKDQIVAKFNDVHDGNQEVDWRGVATILNDTMGERIIPDDIYRALMALGDPDVRGKIKVDEVIYLYKCISTWKMAFKLYDLDNNGYLNGLELREVLASMGTSVDNKTLQIIGLRYCDLEGNLSFEDFLRCSIKLKAIADVSSELSEDTDAGDTSEDTQSNDSSDDKWWHMILYT